MKKHMLLTVVAALGLLSVLLQVRQAANPRHHVPPSPSSAIPGVLDKSIAVLPFLDLSDNQQMAWFAEDVRDEILLKLAKVDGFKIVRPSNAAYFLEGNVRRVDNRITVHVQLINVGRDKSIWAETYYRDLPMASL
jgi:TolB-like protein